MSAEMRILQGLGVRAFNRLPSGERRQPSVYRRVAPPTKFRRMCGNCDRWFTGSIEIYLCPECQLT